MKMSEQINELTTAFSKAQGMMKSASKDASNPFFKSTYATLASVIEALREPFALNGLSFMQPCDFRDDGTIIVETVIFHSTGQWVSGIITGKPVKNDPQGVGSLISYLKRYGLQAMTGIASADDDAEDAMVRNKQQPEKLKPPVSPPVDKTLLKIKYLISKLTKDFKDRDKYKIILDELKIKDPKEFTTLSEEQKHEVIAVLEHMISEENIV